MKSIFMQTGLSGMEENGRGETLCKVCGDKASGKHYGVPSCDGCRGFFKRSIRRNLDYVCKENGRCVVDVSRRNQCQACRFTKCLQVNMKRDAVQHERAPRSTSSLVAAARRTSSGLYTGIPNVYHPASSTYHPLLYPALFPFKPTVPAFTPSVAHFLPRPSPESLSMTTAKEDEVTSSEEAATVDVRIESKEELVSTRLAPPVITSVSSEYTMQGLSLLPTENIYEFAAKLLFFAVRWARSIHSFLELPYRDQTILLEESWSELFVLTAAQWNFPVDETTLVPVDLPIERREVLLDKARRLRELLVKCAALRVDHSEYACLKAIVLFKAGEQVRSDLLAVHELLISADFCEAPPIISYSSHLTTVTKRAALSFRSIVESRNLCEPGRVAALQEQTVAVFCERDARRVGRLLLLLPPARALCRATLHELLFKPTVGDVSVERLLGDMVGALRPA
ncbi:PREDICTED: nuclear receptor subfamily 2 group E member 1-like [Vollenhovia emeryi]|uniref:nuclear receptor subfamily 2 group E member 1-like n=1 Tax=Vollenhovia emeryi TaxID=411798 RepID=UPI0005F3BB8B|nr:PREDICTED: nuclear receptor subfamily 2 group E member 1-like [Vollenhovia emeryi]